MFNKLLIVLLLLSTSDAFAASPAVTFGCPGYDSSQSQECATHTGTDNYVDIYQRSSLESLSTESSVYANYSIAFFQPITSSLSYSFEVLSSSGTPSGFVPLLITASGYAEALGLNKAEANIATTLNMANPNVFRACAGKGCAVNAQTSFGGTFSASAAAGQEQTITLVSSVQMNGTIGNVKAVLDPYIQIDPTFAALHPGYYLNFSAGVTNVAAVPEPETYAMMILGLGVVARRVKQKLQRT